MNKSEFLKKLQAALRWTFSAKEIEDILSDYEGFFASGKSEGKSEQQVCAELGNPASAALDLAEELHKKRSILISLKALKHILLAVLLAVTALVFYFAGYRIVYYYWYEVVVIIAAFVAVLWFALGGTFRKLPPIPKNLLKHDKVCMGILHGVLAILSVGYYFLLCSLLSNVDNLPEWFSELIEPSRLGPFLVNIYNLFSLVIFSIFIFSLFAFYRRSAQFFTLSCHAVGAFVYVSNVERFLWRMADSTEGMSKIINPSIIAYAVSVLLTVLFSLFIRFISVREKKAGRE